MESFFGILKSECFHGEKFKSVDEWEQKVKEYVHDYLTMNKSRLN